MKIVKTITVEGISDADCNQKIVDSLDFGVIKDDSSYSPTAHDYTFGKIGLIQLLREYEKTSDKSLMGTKQFVENNARKHER